MENFQAVMRLTDRRSTNGSAYIFRYALIGNNVADYLSITLSAKSKTKCGKIWQFDPQSSDPEIREKSLEDVAWFKRETGQDLTRYLPVGTPVILSRTETPVKLFLTGYRADVTFDPESGLAFVSQHPDLVAEQVKLQTQFRETRDTMRLAGLSRETQDATIAQSFSAVLTEEIKNLRSIKTPTVNLSELDFSKINFGAVPDLTPPVETPKEQDITPDFSTPADSQDDDTKA